MLPRLHAIVVVIFIVAATGASPGLSPVARAESRTVTVAIYPLDPVVMTRDGVRTGFTIDVLNEVAKRAGWTLSYDEIANGSSERILREVLEGRADIAGDPISITAERMKTVDFSQPFLSGGLQIMVPGDTVEHSEPGLKSFLKLLLSKAMLIWFLVALILAVVPAHIIWLLERRQDDAMVSRSYYPGIFQAFRWGLGMLTASAEEAPRHGVARIVGVMWAFVSLIFISYYTAILTANLTADKFDSKISGPADLIGKRVCAPAESTGSQFLADIGVPHETPVNHSDCYAGLGGKYDAVVDDSALLRNDARNEGAGRVAVVGPVFKARDYGVGFPIGSDLRKPFDDALLSMREEGYLGALQEKWLGPAE